jgi:uncharacterized protein YndB with AHSA1/START domain
MKTSTTDRIERSIVLRVPRSRVWRALTDAAEFGSWFGVVMKGAFAPGATVSGRVTHPGYEDMIMEITIEKMEPERLFSWRWHPHAVDPKVDYSHEPTTLVVFTLADVPEGTRLTVVESGFDRVPLPRRTEAYRLNDDGWAQQLQAIARHVA